MALVSCFLFRVQRDHRVGKGGDNFSIVSLAGADDITSASRRAASNDRTEFSGAGQRSFQFFDQSIL
ncbi:MAG: hypothetical protein U1E20_08850 [Methylocystis sp.]|uniref:hypothetical protein n=1 Tax=Methylocystis sp. TaxID=1911079 RepID=UPI003922E66B